jgi:subtilase family protein
MAVSDADRELLARHRPELRFHPLEPYRADSPRIMTDGFAESQWSNQLVNRPSGLVLARSRPVGAGAALTLDLLAKDGHGYYPGGPDACKDDFVAARDGTMVADASRLRRRPGWHDVVFCRKAPGADGRSWLQYWFFYYDNTRHFLWIGRHQGDWEMIQIAVAGDLPTPVCVTYAQHDGGERRDWEDVAKADEAGEVPVVYVACASHASYFDAATFRRIGGLGNDHTADGPDQLRPDPYFVDEDVDHWVRWPGRWGSTWQMQDKSPESPGCQDSWLEPEAFHFRHAREGRPRRAALEEALVAERPAAPDTLTASIVDGALVVSYAFPLRLPERTTAPARIQLAVYGAEGPPAAGSYDVTALDGTVRHPLPDSGPPYRLMAGVYDEQDNERLLEPLDVAAPARPGGLEAMVVPAPGAPAADAGRRPAAMPTALRVLAEAPEGTADPPAAAAALAARAAADLGPWTAAPLFARTGPEADPALARWVALSSASVPPPGTDVAALAFDAAHRLATEGWTAEPDLPSSVFVVDPPEDDDEAPATALEARVAEDDAWALRAVRAPGAWDLTPPEGGLRHGRGVVIGQADTGYTDHPELQLGALDHQRQLDILTGRDDAHAVLRGVPPAHFPSHGTSTASVAVSREPGRITGTAPLATLVPIRAATTVVHIHNGNLAAAVDYARELDVGVITMSMGGIAYPAALRTAIQRAVEAGIIVMAAAGQPLPIVVAPACFPECLGVAGSRADDRPWRLSARGPEVDWAAPAKKVPVAATDNHERFHFGRHTGTSFSVALSAGIAALWLAHHGGAHAVRDVVGDPAAVQWVFKALVQETARRPGGWDDAYGAGIIDAAALLARSPEGIAPAAPSPEPPADPVQRAAARLAALLDRSRDEARDRLLALVGGDAERLAPVAGEIVYRAAEDGELRATLAGPPPSGLELAATPDAAAARARLATLASPELLAALA